MNTAKIQTPIDNDILQKVRNMAEDLGFSSVNELVRVLLKNFADNKIVLSISSRQKPLYTRQKWDNTLRETVAEYKVGKRKSYKSVDELMDDLDE